MIGGEKRGSVVVIVLIPKKINPMKTHQLYRIYKHDRMRKKGDKCMHMVVILTAFAMKTHHLKCRHDRRGEKRYVVVCQSL